MELTVIGSGTSLPQDGRGAPGYVVRTGGRRVVFELGPGSVHRWALAGVSCLEVEDIFISHLHPDHAADLVSLLFALRSPVVDRRRPLQIVGPVGLKDLYHGLVGVYGRWVEESGYELTFHEVASGEVRHQEFLATSRRVNHTPSSLGYRLESAGGRVLAYSGDTGYCRSIVELGRGAHLLLLECSFPEERRVEGHLTPTEAGRIAAECGVERLVLTHFYPVFDGIDILARVREAYDGEVVLARDMMRIEV